MANGALLCVYVCARAVQCIITALGVFHELCCLCICVLDRYIPSALLIISLKILFAMLMIIVHKVQSNAL